MERIEAIIRPERLNIVKDSLAEAGLTGLNVTPVTDGALRSEFKLVGLGALGVIRWTCFRK